jgi:hypothetical protein
MSCENPTRSGSNDPAAEDRRTERAVLAFLLDQHPAPLTITELSLALNAGEDFAAEDAVERAVRELVCAGLLRLTGGLVCPTRAALYFERLEAH